MRPFAPLFVRLTLAAFLATLAGARALADDQLAQPARWTGGRTTLARDAESKTPTAEYASETREREPDQGTATPERAPIPLAKRGAAAEREASVARPRGPANASSTMLSVAGSLAAVLGLFFVAAWLLRRNLPQGSRKLSSDAVEPLGRMPLGPKQELMLVRVGVKLVLIAVGPAGVTTLTEIKEPDEVARLTAMCRQQGPHGPAAEFRAVLAHFERQPAEPGFLGTTLASGRGGVHA